MINQDKQSPEAERKGICHTRQECEQMYKEIPEELKNPALVMLKKELAYVSVEIRKAYQSSPNDWYVRHHFNWGMSVRNLLREKGFGEDYFKIHNLDDIYIALVEEALALHS